MGLVKCNDFVCCAREAFPGFVADEDSVDVAAEDVFEHEESHVSPYGWRTDGSLIVDAQGFAREETMDPRP